MSQGRYYILTLGCQMNKGDSERIAALLEQMDLSVAANPEEGDVLIINTCSVRQSAEDRVYGILRNWQTLRLKKPDLIICLTGCMAGRDKDCKLRAKLKGVDLFFPLIDLPMLPKWLGELAPPLLSKEGFGGGLPSSDGNPPAVSLPPRSGTPLAAVVGKEDGLRGKGDGNYLDIAPARESNFQASVVIQNGCDNFCSYCVVPYSRGRERNRPLAAILKEIQQAAEGGCREVTLLGQVVNNYKAPDSENFSVRNVFRGADDFAALLWEVNQIPDIKRIHWIAADPQYFNDDQIQALLLPHQVNYLHLPAQSGSNEILKKMNRKYTREKYLEKIKKIRSVKPDMAIGTDLIVGFCGETVEQFEETLDLYRQCDFDIAYPAMYSERSGTAAAKVFKDDVPQAEKKRRWQAIQGLMEEITYRKNQKYFNQTVSVLVESCDTGICSGHSREMKLVQSPGSPDLVGQIIFVKIVQSELWVLRGIKI